MIYLAYFNIEGYNSYSGCDITVTAALPNIDGEAANKYYTLGSLQTLSISTHQDKRPVRSIGIINAKEYVMGPRTIAGSMVFAVFDKHFANRIFNDLKTYSEDVILTDEIPALNITINFANEYGRMSRMAIYGVKIINEGQVMSINDLYTENTYQFVALGMEPLTDEINENKLSYTRKKNEYMIETAEPTYSKQEIVTPEWFEFSGEEIVDDIINNKEYGSLKPKTIILSVTVEDPLNKNENGIASFTLSPDQDDGFIYIVSTNTLKPLAYKVPVDKKDIYKISLPIGYYEAYYSNNDNSIYSYTISFVISYNAPKVIEDFLNDTPIIKKITDTYMIIESNNINHTSLCYYKDSEINSNKKNIINNISIGKDIMISNLEPNTYYNIYTFNKVNKSKEIRAKTYITENEDVDMLKQYIQSNKNIVKTDYSILLDYIEQIPFEKYNTLIDGVLTLKDSNEKQELLIFSTKLTNQLIDSYNKNNSYHILNNIQDNPFDNTILLENEDTVYYCSNNNYKYYLEEVITDQHEFLAKSNKHYYVYNTINNIKSIKKDFTVCKHNSYETLLDYTNIKKYLELDYSYYSSKYMTYEESLIEILMIRDANTADLNLLPPPYMYYEDNILYADINYELLDANKNYYIAYSELYETLDYTPHRKIEFTINDSLINVDSYYPGILNQKKYIYWIEDENGLKISKSSVLMNDKFIDSNIIKDYNFLEKKELNEKLTLIKKDFINHSKDKLFIDDLFGLIYSMNPVKKNLEFTLINEFLIIAKKSLYISNVLNTLYDLLISINNYSSICYINNIKIDIINKTIHIDDLNDYKIYAITYTGEDSFIRNTININTISYSNKGYTVLYILDRFNNYIAMLVIEGATNKYKYTSNLEDCIKELM